MSTTTATPARSYAAHSAPLWKRWLLTRETAVIVLTAAVIYFLLRYTRFGYQIYAVGGSEDVSKLSGLRTHRTIIGAHILCSLTAVITGIFLASRLKAGGNRKETGWS